MFPQRASPDSTDPYIQPATATAGLSSGVENLLHTSRSSLTSYAEGSGKAVAKSRVPPTPHQDLSVPSVLDATQSPTTHKESQIRLKALVSAVLKVLTKDQVMVVVMDPHSVHWVTTHQQKQLSASANSVESITAALVPMLGGPNSELVAEHLVKASACARMGMPTQHTIELHASERSYKADLDCYFGEPNLEAIVALLTPMHENSFSGYEKAQLSCIRYHISIEGVGAYGTASSPTLFSHTSHTAALSPVTPREPSFRHNQTRQHDMSHHTTSPASSNGTGWADSSGNEALNDFIPSMAYREVDYFYSLLPGNGHPGYATEMDIERSESVQEHEQRAVDPDTLDPHMRMRMLQQSSLMPVLPREPRKFAEVQREIFDARLLALQRVTSSTNKKSDVKCLECGTENSPEWRKGPLGPKTLCNRCGLRYAKRLRGQK